MSLITTLKDYIELLNTTSDSASGNLTLQAFTSETLIFVAASLKNFFLFLFSFRWLRDIAYLPVLVPQLSLSGLKDILSLDETISFSTTSNFSTIKFFAGFLNSIFFVCLFRLRILFVYDE